VTKGQLRFGPDDGRLLLRTGRSGVGSTVGHDLTIEMTDWWVQVDIPEARLEDATVTAGIELDSLVVREGTGGVKPLSDKDRADIVGNARRTLDSHRYPHATFESTGIVREAPDADAGTITGTLTLHGVSAPIVIQVESVPDGYRASAVVTQTAYGVKPYSALLGALKVRDDVAVEIEVRTPG
jgi:polyisoprenoid-binding protein YceI